MQCVPKNLSPFTLVLEVKMAGKKRTKVAAEHLLPQSPVKAAAYTEHKLAVIIMEALLFKDFVGQRMITNVLDGIHEGILLKILWTAGFLREKDSCTDFTASVTIYRGLTCRFNGIFRLGLPERTPLWRPGFGTYFNVRPVLVLTNYIYGFDSKQKGYKGVLKLQSSLFHPDTIAILERVSQTKYYETADKEDEI